MSTATTKLTLSVGKTLIEDAKRLAVRRRTSVSSMFTAFLQSMTQVDRTVGPMLGPITKKASGLVKLPGGRTDAQLVEDAVSAKYRSSK